MAYIRSGRHIGKVVISDGDKSNVQVPIRPAVRKVTLRSDASYLIVGGLKGLCGNLAVYMAQLGAKRIIVCSRSGIGDDGSQKIVLNCLAHGCQVIEAKGDVGNIGFVRTVFKDASPRISGIIQGAMILRVCCSAHNMCASRLIGCVVGQTLRDNGTGRISCCPLWQT